MLQVRMVTTKPPLGRDLSGLRQAAHLRADARVEHRSEGGNDMAVERALDEVLADSFPASDPPSWNPGVVRPGPLLGAEHQPTSARTRVKASEARTTADAIDTSHLIGSEPTFVQGLFSLGGAMGVVLLVPFAILLIGLPIALIIRGVLEGFKWVFLALG